MRTVQKTFMVRVVVGLVICGLVRLATRSVPRASATRTGGRRTRTRHHTRMMPVNSEGGGVRSAAGGAAATHEEETYDDRARIRFCEEARRREDARSHDVIEKQSLKTRVELVDGVERPTRGSKAGGDTTVDKVFRESGVMRHIRGFATWSHAPPCEKVTRRLERSVRDRNALDDRLIDLTRQDVDNVRSALDDGASPEAMYAVVRTDLSRPLPSPVMLRMLSTYDAPGRKALVGASEAEEGERTCAAALRAALRAGGGDDGRRNEARVQQRALTDAAKAICGPNVPDEAGDEHNVLEELVSLYNELLLNTNELHALLERDAQETVALDAFLTEMLQLSPDDEVLLGTTLPRIVLAAGCYSLGTDIGHGLSILHILAQYDDVRLLRGFVPRMTPEQFAIKDNGGRTPLHWAVEQHHDQVFRMFLPHMTSEQISTRDNKGRTTLYLAAAFNAEEIVGLLLEHMTPAQVRFQRNDGRTALDVAESKEHDDVAEMIRNAMGAN